MPLREPARSMHIPSIDELCKSKPIRSRHDAPESPLGMQQRRLFTLPHILSYLRTLGM